MFGCTVYPVYPAPRGELLGEFRSAHPRLARTTSAHRNGVVPHLPRVTYSFRINICKSLSKQTTLTPFRMNTYEKQGVGGGREYRRSEQNIPPHKTDPVGAYPACPELLGDLVGRLSLSQVASHRSSPLCHCIGEAIVPEWFLNGVLTPHRETSPLVPVSKSSRADAGCGSFIPAIPGQVSCRQAGPGSIQSGCAIQRAGKPGTVRLGQYPPVRPPPIRTLPRPPSR